MQFSLKYFRAWRIFPFFFPKFPFCCYWLRSVTDRFMSTWTQLIASKIDVVWLNRWWVTTYDSSVPLSAQIRNTLIISDTICSGNTHFRRSVFNFHVNYLFCASEASHSRLVKKSVKSTRNGFFAKNNFGENFLNLTIFSWKKCKFFG